jgi:hypothetical protein
MRARWIPEGTPGIHPFDSRPVAGFVQVEDDATLELLISLAKA